MSNSSIPTSGSSLMQKIQKIPKHKLKWGVIMGILIAVVLLIAGVVVSIVLSKNNKNESPTSLFIFPDSPVAYIADNRSFFDMGSTDGELGRTNKGDLNSGIDVKEAGMRTSKDLEKYGCMFPIGHPFWNTGTFGCIESASWDEHLSRFGIQQMFSTCLANKNGVIDTGTVVIEAPTSGEPSPVVMDIADLKISNGGLVVRKGGILLIKGDFNLETQFILIESGGMLQSGSQFNEMRFRNKFNVVLTHPDGGYNSCGNLSSQYSYEIYNPGVLRKEDDGITSSYQGLEDQCVCNKFGVSKCIAVGFNGTLHLAGEVGDSVAYKNTWYATDTSDGTLFSDDPITTNGSDAYKPTWARLGNGTFDKGATEVTIDANDIGIVRNWSVGGKVVITNQNEQYTQYINNDAVVPCAVWMDTAHKASNDANVVANKGYVSKFINPLSRDGPELATIKEIKDNGRTIVFERGLMFRHISNHTKINNANHDVKEISVSTCCHIGLLSRNITITSRLNAGGNGGNTITKNKSCHHDTTKSTRVAWSGPGGYLVSETSKVVQGKPEIYTRCYEARNTADPEYVGAQSQLLPQMKGHWFFETEGLVGPNSMFGGHMMFRYGASVTIDGVEISKMSTPANFGSLGRYAVHWHLAGHPRTWTDYLYKNDKYGTSQEKYTRDACLANCSNYCSFSRWVTVHGTSEVIVKNNVFFGAFGSGIFVEDGTELFNEFDHNLCVYNVTARPDTYINTVPLYPNVSSDSSVPSIIWLKNNQNRVLRNIGCNSPIIGIWYVPQWIGTLRGASTICVGDFNRKLPGMASLGAVMNSTNSAYMSETLVTFDKNKSWFKEKFGNDKACYAPQNFIDKLLVGKDTLCPVYSKSNDLNPFQLCAENVFYNIFTSMTTFPEAIGKPPCHIDGSANFQSTWSKAIGDKLFSQSSIYLPFDTQNAATDSQQVAISVYTESTWASTNVEKEKVDMDYPFNPIQSEEFGELDQHTSSKIQKANLVPQIISGLLTFNMGAGSELHGGAGWLKQSPVFLLNCCFIETSYRVRDKKVSHTPPFDAADSIYAFAYTGDTSVTNTHPARSVAFPISTGDSSNKFTQLYHVVHNFITNGGFSIPANPMVLHGQKSYFGDLALILRDEYNSLPIAVNEFYAVNTVEISKLFPNSMAAEKMQNYTTKIHFSIYDTGRKMKYTSDTEGFQVASSLEMSKSDARRLPYMCNENSLFEFEGRIVIDVATDAFHTPNAIALGNDICAAISFIRAPAS